MRPKNILRFVLIGGALFFILFQVFLRPFDRPQPSDGMTDMLERVVEATQPVLGVVFRVFDFNQKNALAEWEEKLFEGRVAYWVDLNDENGFLHSKSEDASSAIFRRVKYDLSEFPMLTWKWRVARFPDKGGVEDVVARDDFAARVYVVFLTSFFLNLQCIEYLWDETAPEGTVTDSPFSNNIKRLVVQSGPMADNEWVKEARNVIEDYEMLFGKPPKKRVAAIAVMTDSDGTAGEAEGLFDDIQIGKENT